MNAKKTRRQDKLGGKMPAERRAEHNLIGGLVVRDINEDEEFQLPCRADPDAWFDMDQDGNGATAKRACGACEFRSACLDAALHFEAGRIAGGSQSGDRWGIWGGMDPHEREVEERKRRAEGTWKWD